MEKDQDFNQTVGKFSLDTFLWWQQFETEREDVKTEDKLVIIDTDSLPKNYQRDGVKVKSRDEVGQRFELIASLLGPEDPDEATADPDKYFTRGRVETGQAVLRRLEIGNDYPLADYVKDTTDIVLVRVTEAELEQQLDVVKRAFAEIDPRARQIGYGLASRDFLSTHKALDSRTFLNRFEDTVKDTKEVLISELNIKDPLSYRLTSRSKDESWLFWANGNREEFIFTVNTHTRHKDKRLDGNPERLGIHEYFHVAHYAKVLENLDAGKVKNPAQRITTIPGREQFVLEGLADTAVEFYPELFRLLGWTGKFSYHLQGLSRMVGVNIHLDVMEGKVSDAEMIRFYLNYLPTMTREDAELAIRSRREGIMWPSYHADYEDGFLFHWRLAKKLAQKPALARRYVQMATHQYWRKPQVLRLAEQLEAS